MNLRVKLLVVFVLISLAFINQTHALEGLEFETAKIVVIPESLTFNGTVEAVNQGTASAQTSGRVIEVFFDVGDLVEKNEVMLRLEDASQAAEYESAEAALKAAKANSQAAEKDFIRKQEIYQKKLISRAIFDDALAKKDTSRAAMEVAEARLKNAAVQVEYTIIRAPYSGLVLERHVEVGETVSPGKPVYSGMSLESMRVVADVPQKDIYQIRKYKHAIIVTPDGSNLEINNSELTFFGHADPQTSTFKVRVKLPTVEGLYPGMYLKTRFQIGNIEALVVPVSSIVYRGEVTAVYLKQTAAKLNFRQIRIGRKFSNNTIEVLSGLAVGESVVVNPVEAIQAQQSK